MKRVYESPNVNVLSFEAEDVVHTSLQVETSGEGFFDGYVSGWW